MIFVLLRIVGIIECCKLCNRFSKIGLLGIDCFFILLGYRGNEDLS